MNNTPLKAKFDLIRNEGACNLSTISNLSAYFNFIHTHYSSQYSSLKDKLSPIEDLNPLEPTTASNFTSSISTLHSLFKDLTTKASKLLDKFTQDIIAPLNSFHQNQSQIIDIIASKFQLLIDNTTKAQRSLDNAKYIYYNSCYLLKQKANANDKDKDKDHKEAITIQRLQLTKITNERLYSYEHSNYSRIITECNSQYDKLISEYKQNEESRIYFIKYIIDKYTALITEYKELIRKMIAIINDELFSTKNCEEELQMINKKINGDDNGDMEVFPIEKYIPFDEYDNQLSNSNEEEPLSLMMHSSFNYEIITSTEAIDEVKLGETILKAKEQLLSKEDIDIELISQVIKHLRSNIYMTGNYLLNAFSDCEWYQCLNYYNYNCLLSLMLFIDNSINEDKEKDKLNDKHDISEAQYVSLREKHQLISKIINVSQKIFFNHSTCILKNKSYLCTLLSQKDPMFESKGFWKDMFNMTIAIKLNTHLLTASSSSSNKQSINEDNNNDNESNQPQPQHQHQSHMSRAKSLITYASSSVSSSIMSRIWPSNDTKSKSILYKTKISQYILNYSKLNVNEMQSIEEMAIDLIKSSLLMKIFISDMIYFNYSIDKVIELMTEIGEETKISKDYINYYISIANVNQYSIRRQMHYTNSNGNDDGNGSNALTSIKLLRLSAKERRVQLIIFSLDYLQWKDYYSLLLLNKATHKKLANKIYKKALHKPKLLINTRLEIWLSILKGHPLLQTNPNHNNYESLLSKALTQLDSKTKHSIEIDIPRTYIPASQDKLKAQTAIQNILFAIAQLNGDSDTTFDTNANVNADEDSDIKGKYCQGMNYIAQFLYEITQDESKAFLIFLSIFKSTEYSLIFGQDLLKFKMFFYVFDRLLFLNAPEISSLFKSSNSDVYYYLAPCFYPLFLNAREGIPSEAPIVLLRILDGFITSGWKGLMKVALNLIDYTETDMLKMPNDTLYEFITTKIFKCDFFRDEKVDMYELLYQKKIHKKVIEYIEQEYIQDIALKEIEKKKRKEDKGE